MDKLNTQQLTVVAQLMGISLAQIYNLLQGREPAIDEVAQVVARRVQDAQDAYTNSIVIRNRVVEYITDLGGAG